MALVVRTVRTFADRLQECDRVLIVLHSANGQVVRRRFLQGSSESAGPHFQSDADLSRIVFGEVNTGLLKSLLYFEDG